MALIKCHECGKDHSDELKKCLHCGAKKKKVGKSITLFQKIIYGALGVGIIGAIATTQQTAPTPQQTDGEKATESARYVVAFSAGKALKNSARDPESLSIDSAIAADDGSAVCVEYRARNGFGGINREFIVVSDTKTYNTTAAWNKHCTKKMHDVISAVKRGASS